jgi:hypothetical protein
MVRIRHGWLVAVIGLALPFATACKKDEKKPDPAGEKTGEAEKSAPAKAADDLSLLPVDSEVVIGINLAQVQASPLWKQFVEPRLMTAETTKQITEFKDKCGIDPMTAVKSVSMGIKLNGDKPDGVIVASGIDKGKGWACLDAMKAEISKDGTEYTREGDVALFKSKDGEQAAFMFINDNTALMVVGTKGTAAGIKTVASGASGLKGSQAFVDMHSKINTKDSLWALINGRLLERAAALGIKAKALYGSVNVTDGLAADVRMLAESPEAATGVATMLKGQSAQAAQMVDKVEVTNDGAEVRIQMAISNQKLQGLISQFGGMMGAIGGGGK